MNVCRIPGLLGKQPRSDSLAYCRRTLLSSPVCYGGVKMKRKKQGLRAENPHLPVREKEKTAQSLALSNFDQYYSQFYGSRWNSIRLGLLSRQKYCALINNFGEPERSEDKLRELGCIDVREMFLKRTNQRNEHQAVSEDSAIRTTTADSEESDESESIEERKSSSSLSLSADRAAERYIDPDERVIGDTAASMYDYVPTKKLKGSEDFIEESEYYDYYKTPSKETISVEKCESINFPEHLKVFTFPRNVLDHFPPPVPGVGGNLNYYCLDGGSLFPVLALDLKPRQHVLDMCAGPGGKTLAALQTLLPEKLVCNDIHGHRLGRVGSVLEQYCGVGSGVGNIRQTVSFSKGCATELLDYGVYDRVLCDVPCFSDRHSVTSDAENLFAKKMIKNRLLLPEEQCRLLKAGLMYLKPGGSLVYSTCTLSPVQNEGVVNMALKSLWEETSYDFCVADLTEALKPFRFMCKIFGAKQGINLGNLIVPTMSNNFGPIYFCKITRKS